LKKRFLDGFRGKAALRLNIAILLGVVVVSIFLRVGRSDWSKRTGAEVPLVWKYVALFALLVIQVFNCRQIYRGIWDRVSPRLNPVWMVFEAIIFFIFAVISADQQTLFNIGCLLWAAAVFLTKRYYSRELKLAKPMKTHAPHDD
jgi:hypothetical protein